MPKPALPKPDLPAPNHARPPLLPRALTGPLWRAAYALLLPAVFVLTWLENASAESRENLGRVALCLALMVAGVTATDIIRIAFA